jgi:hypothetical protein
MPFTISLGHYGLQPPVVSARVLVIDPGEQHAGKRFICLQLGEDASYIPEGFDGDAVTHARQIAGALTRAADEIEQALALKDAIPATVEA